MLATVHQYDLITPLAQKYSHATYLASPTNPHREHGEPERQVILMLFTGSLFHFPQQYENFLWQAQRLKELQHPHLLPILDVGREAECPFVVRPYLPQESLRSRLKKLSPDRMDWRDALALVWQVGQAIAYAHEHHLIHGNIKPENILFDAHDQPVLVDFPLVSRKDVLLRDEATQEYAFCYLAPEQFADTSDAKSDQYALGCLAYELLAGQVPFAARSLLSMMEQPDPTAPTLLSKRVPDLPSSLDSAIHQALAHHPAKRFSDVSLFLEAITSVVSPPPAFPFSPALPLHQKRSRTHLIPQGSEDAATSSHPEGERVAPAGTFPLSDVSLPEWAGILPVSEMLPGAIELDHLAFSFLEDPLPAHDTENEVKQEDAEASSQTTVPSLLSGYSEPAVTEPISEKSEGTGPRTALLLRRRRRGFKLALLLSVCIGMICSGWCLSALVTTQTNLPAQKKGGQEATTPITNRAEPTDLATDPRSPQAALTPPVQPSGHLMSPPPISSPLSWTSPSAGTAPPPRSYEAESSQNTLGGNARIGNCSGCSGGKKVRYIGLSGTLQFNTVNEATTDTYQLTISYVDGGTDRSLLMSVNGAGAVTLSFHGTNNGNWNVPQSLSVLVSLNTGNNTMKFFNPSAHGPDIDRIVV